MAKSDMKDTTLYLPRFASDMKVNCHGKERGLQKDAMNVTSHGVFECH